MKKIDNFRQQHLAALFLWSLPMVAALSLGCGGSAPKSSDDGTDPEGADAGTDGEEETSTKSSDDGTDPEGADAGTDGEEETPACLSEIDSTLAEADAEELFDLDHVPIFDIYLPEAEWEELVENAVYEEYTEAQACFDGRGIGTVGLRFKGSYDSLYDCFEGSELICDRLSMKLKFNKYIEEQRFFGLKRINFNGNRHDDSRMKERLTYDLFRAMGIISPRAAWAVVRVNGRSYGLYGMVEQVDGRFTNNRWPDYPDGNVYKEAWPTDTDAAFLTSALRTNEEVADVSGFQTFSESIAAADEVEVLTTLAEFTDLEHWTRFMAVEDAVASYDGITYFWTDGETAHNHNYYFYEDSPGHLTLVPWDVESTFWINPDHAAPHWTEVPEDCGLTYPYWGGLAEAPACDPIIRALGTDLGAWRDAARELLDGPFAVDTMSEQIDRHQALIGEEARAKETPTMYTSFDNAVEGLRSAVTDLRDRLEALIAETK
jgi:hypothetical protein